MATQVKIAQFKNGLSRYLRSVQRGGEIIVKDRDTPIARVVPYEERKGRLTIRPPTRPLRDLEKLPRVAPKGLTPKILDQVLREVRKDRLDDLL